MNKHSACALIIISFFITEASAEGLGYRVLDSKKTLSQVAMDLYGNQRNWKDLAYWNNLEKPYNLKKGQVLFLPMPPKKNVAEENLVHGIKEPDPKDLKGRASVKQQLEKTTEGYIYIVNERAPWLWMVARDLYGNPKMADQIAQWNNLGSAVKVHLGQKLKLELAPTISADEGTAILVKHWSSLGNEEMATRLTEGAQAVVGKVSPVLQQKKVAAAVKEVVLKRTVHTKTEIKEPVVVKKEETVSVKNEPVIKENKITDSAEHKMAVKDSSVIQEAVAVIQKKLEKLENKQAVIETRVEKLEVVTKASPIAKQEKQSSENHTAKSEEKTVNALPARAEVKEAPQAAASTKSESKENAVVNESAKAEEKEAPQAAVPTKLEKVADAPMPAPAKEAKDSKSKKEIAAPSAPAEKENVAEDEVREQKSDSKAHSKKSAKKAKSHEAVEEEESSEVAPHVKAAKGSKSLPQASKAVAVPCCMREPATPDVSNPGKEPKSPEYWLGPYSQQIIDKIDKKLKTKEK